MTNKETPKERRERLREQRVNKHLSTGGSAGGSKKPKRTRLEELYLFKHRPFVDNLIDTGASHKSITDYLRGKGFNTTADTVRNYIKAREAAVKYKGFADFNDFGRNRPDYAKMKALTKQQRTKLQEEYMKRFDGTEQLSDQEKELEVNGEKMTRTPLDQLNSVARHRRKQYRNNKSKVMTDIQFLDVLIQKGMETLSQMPSIDPGKAIKAIELKHKLTQGKHDGLTIYGMEEIRLRENARENAMVEVIQRFVSPDKQEELLEVLEATSRDFYKAHGLDDLSNRSSASDIERYLAEEGLEPEEDDDYYTEDEVGEN